MIPEKIDRYVVESEIGRGGMATVYKAYDPRFERSVALKVLPREFLHEPEFRARFHREAKVIAALEHYAIVPVYDFGEDDNQPFLVMRLMTGGSLSDRLEKGSIPLEETSKIFDRLCSALSRAHSQGLVHRDLKPSNVLFDQDNQAYLADFGIVRVASSSSALTASGSVVGTPTYMSPEQVYGDKEIDARSDIYALGVILFQMLTGHAPYDADTPAKVMMKHILDPVPQLHQTRPDLPQDFDDVISRAMAKERDARYSSAKDLSVALATAVTQRMQQPNINAELAALQAGITPTVTHEKTPTPTPPIQQSPVEVPETAESTLTPPQPSPVELPPAPISEPIIHTPPTESAPRRWTAFMVGGIVVVCLLCIVGIYVIYSFIDDLEITPTETSVAVVQATATPEASTEEPEATATASQLQLPTDTPAVIPSNTPASSGPIEGADATRQSLEATRAAALTPVENNADATRQSLEATRAAAAAQTPDATATSSISQEYGPDAVFGPVDGEIPHDSDEFLESIYAGVSLSNFMARITFDNPYPISEGDWDFGFIFRQEDFNHELRLIVLSDGSWSLSNREDTDEETVQEGDVGRYLDTDSTGGNELTLIALDDLGYFFLNGEFIDTLDLSDRTELGDVSATIGFYDSTERAGETTFYEAFTVWPLVPEFGPTNGELTHIDDGFIKTQTSGVEAFNFIVDTTFTNPYTPDDTYGWDWGFAFRETDIDDQFWLIIASDDTWSLIDRVEGEDEFIDDGGNLDIDIDGGGENRLTMIAFTNTGFLFLNGEYIATMDLSSRQEAGDVSVATAFFVGNEIEGNETTFEEWAIWLLP